jgi:hypothetical protein
MENFEKEKSIITQGEYVLGMAVDLALKIIEKLNPQNVILPSTSKSKESKEGITPIIEESRIRSMMNSWLDIVDNTLKQSKDLPIDLIAVASQIAKKMRGDETPQK